MVLKVLGGPGSSISGWSDLITHWWEKPELKWSCLLSFLIFLPHVCCFYAIPHPSTKKTQKITTTPQGKRKTKPEGAPAPDAVYSVVLSVNTLMYLEGCSAHSHPIVLILIFGNSLTLAEEHFNSFPPLFLSTHTHFFSPLAVNLLSCFCYMWFCHHRYYKTHSLLLVLLI